MPNKDEALRQFILDRLHNPNRAAEGPTLPPPNRGGFRVPLAKNLYPARTQRYSGGTQFTLIWDDPEEFREQIDHFNVYALGLYGDNSVPQGPWQCEESPAEIQIDATAVLPVILIVQTQLKNGMTSPMDISPSVGVQTLEPSAGGFAFPDETVPLSALLPWSNLNELIAGNGTSSAPTWKTRATLDLVEGRSTLLVSGVPVVSNASGQIRQVDITEIDDTDSPYTELAADWFILADAAAGAITVDLLTAAGRSAREVNIKKVDASTNIVTVDPAGAETIEGETTGDLTLEGECWTLVSDGTNWRIR